MVADKNSARFAILRVVAPPLVLVVVFGTVVELTEYLYRQNVDLFTNVLPGIVDRSAARLDRLIMIDTNSLRTLLGPLITVSGTFLGLYFTAVNVLLSSTYRQVTADVRFLLLRDDLGNLYTRIVAFTGVYALFVLCLISIGHTPGRVSTVVLLLLGITEFYCFLHQWFRLFRLFDPAGLTDYLQRDLIYWVEKATVTFRFARDTSFQIHFQTNAEKTLSTFRSLISSAAGEEHLRTDTLLKLLTGLLSVMRFYESRKRSIPTDSRWFRARYEHKDWFTAGHMETSMAINTGTTLPVTEGRDHLWVEKEIGAVVELAYEGFIKKGDMNNAVALFNSFQEIGRYLSSNHLSDEAFLLFNIIKGSTRKYYTTHEFPDIRDEASFDALRFHIALIDFYALSFVKILLGFSQSTESITSISLDRLIADARSADPDRIYGHRIPRYVLEELEKFRGRLAFERVVEGRTVTPNWYLKQLLVLSYLRHLHASIDTLLDHLEDVFLSDLNTLSESPRIIFLIQLLERGMEACNKFAYHFADLRGRVEELEKFLITDDMPKPVLEFADYDTRIQQVRERLVAELPRCIPLASVLPRSPAVPDYFGHLYAVLTDECMRALAAGKAELFARIFPATLVACLEGFDRLRKLDLVDVQSKIALVADPIIDLFEVSGFAIIYQDLLGDQFWNTVKEAWDHYFATSTDERVGLIERLFTFAHHNTFITTGRSLMRTSWEQHLMRTLREKGLIDNNAFGGNPFDMEVPAEEVKTIVSVVAGPGFRLEEPRKVFTSIYFAAEILDATLTAPDQGLFDELQEVSTDWL